MRVLALPSAWLGESGRYTRRSLTQGILREVRISDPFQVEYGRRYDVEAGGRLRGATIRGRVANRTWGRVYVRRKGSKSKIHPPGSIVLVRADGSFHVSSPHWPAVYELRWQDPDAYDPSKGPDAVVDASAGGELRVTIGSK